MPEQDNTSIDPPPEIPEKAKPAIAWLSWILLLGGPTFAGLITLYAEGTTAKALTMILGFLVSLAAGLKSGLVNPIKAGGGAASVLAVLLLAGCPTGWKAMWSTTGSVMEATKATSKGGAAVGETYYDECLKKHGSKTQEYWTCIKSTRKWLVSYRDVARPAARSAVAVAYASGRTAEEAGKKPINYMAMLKPGGCALILSLREWGHKLPDKGKAIMEFLQKFTGITCDKVKAPKSAAAIIAALLPVAVDLVKWVISVVGADNGDIKAAINKWIQAPAADEVDAVLKKIDAAAPDGAI